MRYIVAVFGEAEKGQCKRAYFLHDLNQLVDHLGHPPSDSEGIPLAIQAILLQRELIYFRVMEEGMSLLDYFYGLKILKEIQRLDAICLPGISDPEVLAAAYALCKQHHSHLLISGRDFYDFCTLVG